MSVTLKFSICAVVDSSIELLKTANAAGSVLAAIQSISLFCGGGLNVAVTVAVGRALCFDGID
jgi:hypothetical protein